MHDACGMRAYRAQLARRRGVLDREAAHGAQRAAGPTRAVRVRARRARLALQRPAAPARGAPGHARRTLRGVRGGARLRVRERQRVCERRESDKAHLLPLVPAGPRWFHLTARRVWKAADPRRPQDWILKCQQGGRARPLAACGVATLCCPPPGWNWNLNHFWFGKPPEADPRRYQDWVLQRPAEVGVDSPCPARTARTPRGTPPRPTPPPAGSASRRAEDPRPPHWWPRVCPPHHSRWVGAAAAAGGRAGGRAAPCTWSASRRPRR